MNDICFWPHVRNMAIASFRLRCDRVVEELRNERFSISFFDDASVPDKLVISKRYDSRTIDTALELREKHGTKIYLDICDNHFYFEGDDSAAINRAAELKVAVASVDALIVSSHYLGEIARQEVPEVKRIEVIEDFIELEPVASYRHYLRHPILFAGCKTLSRSLDGVGKDKRFRMIWFGNHGSKFVDGGMADLLSIRDVLEELSSRFPVSLTVVSNSEEKYRALISNWSVPTFYRPWNRHTFPVIAALHNVSVIPIVFNPFTLAKTSNRVSTSLINGLKVVADPIPSYKEYEDRVLFSEWSDNLIAAIGDDRKPLMTKQEISERNKKVLMSWKGILA
ncbi:hypothetical protein [Ectopseudomonas khazarica]|uniref:hypothetical protein n=1 Tax=Ectopseudomonas khazarica TaxID=2502979 RepID=UPI0037C929F8